jgi:hypothetical protein
VTCWLKCVLWLMVASQMENIKDRAALLGYDVWIAPRSSLVLQVGSCGGCYLVGFMLTHCNAVATLRLEPP